MSKTTQYINSADGFLDKYNKLQSELKVSKTSGTGFLIVSDGSVIKVGCNKSNIMAEQICKTISNNPHANHSSASKIRERLQKKLKK